jgi:hypothetical protein
MLPLLLLLLLLLLLWQHAAGRPPVNWDLWTNIQVYLCCLLPAVELCSCHKHDHTPASCQGVFWAVFADGWHTFRTLLHCIRACICPGIKGASCVLPVHRDRVVRVVVRLVRHCTQRRPARDVRG